MEKGVETVLGKEEKKVIQEGVEHVKKEGENIIEELKKESPTLGSKIKTKFKSALKSIDEFLSKPIKKREPPKTKMDKFHNFLVKIIPETRNKRIAALLVTFAALVAGLITIIKLTHYYSVKP